MDMQRLFEKTILIRLTDEGDGFVSTIRYGAFYSRSDTWMAGSSDEVIEESFVDDPFNADEN